METEETTPKEEALLKLIEEATELANNAYNATSIAIALSVISVLACITCVIFMRLQ